MSVVTSIEKILADKVREIAEPNNTRESALARAEALADRFADVKPQPYIVPAERYVGLPVRGEVKESVF